MTHASYGIVQPNIEPPSHTFPPRMTFPSVGNGSVLLVLPQFVEVLGKKIDKISDEVGRKHAAFSSYYNVSRVHVLATSFVAGSSEAY